MGPFHFSSAGITHQEPDDARFSIRELDSVHFLRDVSC